MHHLAVDARAGRHFEQLVVDVAFHPRIRREFEPVGRMHVAVDGAVDDDVRRVYLTGHDRMLGQREDRLPALAVYGAVDLAVDVQTSAEADVATDFGAYGDQR